MNTIPEAATYIARVARVGVELGKQSPEAALDTACELAVQNAQNALDRVGQWASRATTQQIEEAVFHGSVAQDILDGTVTRPSTGNVRAYALAVVTGWTFTYEHAACDRCIQLGNEAKSIAVATGSTGGTQEERAFSAVDSRGTLLHAAKAERSPR